MDRSPSGGASPLALDRAEISQVSVGRGRGHLLPRPPGLLPAVPGVPGTPHGRAAPGSAGRALAGGAELAPDRQLSSAGSLAPDPRRHRYAEARPRQGGGGSRQGAGGPGVPGRARAGRVAPRHVPPAAAPPPRT